MSATKTSSKFVPKMRDTPSSVSVPTEASPVIVLLPLSSAVIPPVADA